MTYKPQRPPRRRDLTVRGVPYHFREWGPEHAPCLILLHGSRDSGASYQFVVDALQSEWHVVAPDWRGHGSSGWTPGSYWQAEFVADLDGLLDFFAHDRPVTLVGHSMGGNVASLFAGVAPSRVRHLVMLDAVGDLLNRAPINMHEVLQQILQTRYPGEPRVYLGLDGLASQLMLRNPRLDQARAEFLAMEMARPVQGGYVRCGDPSFRRSQPSLHRTDDWLSIWCHITAPVLIVRSSDARPNSPLNDPAQLQSKLAAFSDVRTVIVPETGHNVHHDAPSFIAGAIERFVQGDMLQA
jgi:pimeloyl-ACP methyl ester carboxylesterase